MLLPKAFTLFELVVVLCSLSVLLGVSLPAIQEARGKNDVIVCQSRIGSIAIGCLDYLEVNGVMPPLNTGPFAQSTIAEVDEMVQMSQNTGAIVYVLPFIGQNRLYDAIPPVATNPDVLLPFDGLDGFSVGNSLLSHPGMRKAYNTKTPEFICPANLKYAVMPTDNLHFLTPRITGDPDTLWSYAFSVAGTTDFGRTSYIPSMGGFMWDYVDDDLGIELTGDQVSGALRIRTNSIPPGDLQDGAANTILWGESNGWIGASSFEGVHFGLFSTALFTGFKWTDYGHAELFGSSVSSALWQIGSNHIEGNNVAMTDGSVRFISRHTDRLVIIQLGCGGDGG